MKFTHKILVTVLQVIFTLLLLVAIFMTLAFLESNLGFKDYAGLITSLLMAFNLSIITILLCLIVGLPIRLNTKLGICWLKNYLIAPIGIIFGLAFITVSMLPNFAYLTVEESFGTVGFSSTKPNPFFSTIGWFLTAFMSLHFFLLTTTKRTNPDL